MAKRHELIRIRNERTNQKSKFKNQNENVKCKNNGFFLKKFCIFIFHFAF